jgi:hypothetical protein
MDYSIETRRNKSMAKCRVCRRSIPTGVLCVFAKGSDNLNKFQLVAHADCLLSFIIKAVKKEQLRVLNEEQVKFKKIEKILEGR